MIFEERLNMRTSFGPMLMLLAVPALCSTLACSDRSLVQKCTAAHLYYEDRYEKKCVAVAGPPTCGPCQRALNSARESVVIANSVYKVGPLPEAEKVELRSTLESVEAECP